MKSKINKYNLANDKFSEAQTFLQKMKNSVEDVMQFRSNLSAFLSAARSVMLIWLDDYDDDPKSKFGIWFDSIFKKFPILKFLQKTRNSNTHEGKLNIEPYGIFSYQIFEIIDDKEYYRSSIKINIMTSEEIDKFIQQNHPGSKIKKVQKPKWKFKGFPKKYFQTDDVIEVSTEILDKLAVFLIQIKYEFPELCD
jgi:hypothetical protein